MSARARNTDPMTSHKAAREFSLKNMMLNVQRLVRLMRANGGPQSDFDIARIWDRMYKFKHSESLPRKARLWACEAGKVKHAGFKKNPDSGRLVMTWRLTRRRSV